MLPDPTRLADHDAYARRLSIAACFCVVVGAKFLVLATHGSETPYWDQWEGEAANFYLPYLSGSLKLSDWVALHNEHRIFLTRVLGLALLRINGGWDPILQMMVNAVIHAATIGFLLVVLSRSLDVFGTLLLAFFCLLLFAVPFGWGNTLAAFQTQFYMLILLGPASLYFLHDSAAWSSRWWIGTLLGVLCYLSMASGALALAASIILAGAQFILRRRSGAGELLGLAFHAVLTAIMLLDVPIVSDNNVLKAGSIADFAQAIVAATGWPVAASIWPTLLRVLAAALLYAPVFILAARLLRERPAIDDRRWLHVGIALSVGLQIVALSYGRTIGILQSRYYDVLLVGVVVNCASLLHLLRADVRGSRRIAHCFAALWLLAVMIGAGQKALIVVPKELAWRRDTAQIQTEHLKQYLATGDFAHLQDKPDSHIPHPLAWRLRDLASNPVIRSILPPTLFGSERSAAKTNALRHGQLLMPIGLALLMIAAIAACTPRRIRN